MKKWAAGLFIALFILYNYHGALAQSDTHAKAACVLDVKTGRVLFAANENKRLPMASTTKVMTALLAIENAAMDDVVTCSDTAYGTPGTSIYLAKGEQLRMEEMLLGLMLTSGNDAAVAIAEHIGGSVSGFAQMMNARAEQIGAKNTHFANPHGLPDDTHYTTAYDLALIAREAMGSSVFRQIVSTQQATIPWAGRTYGRVLKNKNRLLADYPGATGIKTGYTSKAGRCLVFGAKRDDLELIGVVLGCPDWFDEAQRLMDGCFSTYTMAHILGPMESAGRIAVVDGDRDSVGMCLMEELTAPLAEGETAQMILDVPESVAAPVYPGMHLGTARLMAGGSVVGECEVVASERADTAHFSMDVRRVMALWTLSGRIQN